MGGLDLSIGSPMTADPDDAQGDFSPYNYTPARAGIGATIPVTDGLRGDFEERFLEMTRLSNLLTTRSDTFTMYVLVQSWKHVGETGVQPELTWEKRKAYTIDRTDVDPATGNHVVKSPPVKLPAD